MTDRLLDAKEVAERLNVPETWVRAETRAGRIPHFPLGKYRRYDWSEVVAWLETQQAGSGASTNLKGRAREEKCHRPPPLTRPKA
jgi:excisionase family DNA binding protein